MSKVNEDWEDYAILDENDEFPIKNKKDKEIETNKRIEEIEREIDRLNDEKFSHDPYEDMFDDEYISIF